MIGSTGHVRHTREEPENGFLGTVCVPSNSPPAVPQKRPESWKSLRGLIYQEWNEDIMGGSGVATAPTETTTTNTTNIIPPMAKLI
jgi:hypothetical protein